MTMIEQARALGAALQQDELYKNYMAAAEKVDKAPAVQKKIGEFNNMRRELSLEMAKEDKDADRLTALDTDIRAVYDEIMAMPEMDEFNREKEKFDKLMKSIDFILSQAANGEDPMTCPETAPTCTGSCASCGGCG